MIVHIGCIVEGQGDEEAVPELIRRLAQRSHPYVRVDCRAVQRVKRQKLVKPGELERSVEVLARKLTLPRGVLILVDSDREPPGCEAPKLLQRAKSARPDLEAGVVLAHYEFETWFLAAADSLRGLHGFNPPVAVIVDPEAIRGAKERLNRYMPANNPYGEVKHQKEFTKRFDLNAARRHSRSFDKCVREVERLLTALTTAAGAP